MPYSLTYCLKKEIKTLTFVVKIKNAYKLFVYLKKMATVKPLRKHIHFM